jgi:hypothetical protein
MCMIPRILWVSISGEARAIQARDGIHDSTHKPAQGLRYYSEILINSEQTNHNSNNAHCESRVMYELSLE